MYIFYLFVYYMIFNVIFLLPLVFLAFMTKVGIEQLIGPSEMISNFFILTFFMISGVELWFVHRSAQIKSTEVETIDGAIKSAFSEAWMYVLLLLPFKKS